MMTDKFPSKHHTHILTNSTPLTEKLDQKGEAIIKHYTYRREGREDKSGKEEKCERVRGEWR